MSWKAPPQSLVKKHGMDRLPMPANQIFCIFIGFVLLYKVYYIFLIWHIPISLLFCVIFSAIQDEEYPIAFGSMTARSYLAANITEMLFEKERSR